MKVAGGGYQPNACYVTLVIKFLVKLLCGVFCRYLYKHTGEN